MKTFKVLGTGCPKCKALAEAVAQKARQKGVEVTIEKITDMKEIASYGVMSSPALVLDEKLVHAGSLPDDQKLDALFEGLDVKEKETKSSGCCSCCCHKE